MIRWIEGLIVRNADLCNRVKGLIEDEEFDPSVGYEAFRQTAREEWDDPALDVYEQYRNKL